MSKEKIVDVYEITIFYFVRTHNCFGPTYMNTIHLLHIVTKTDLKQTGVRSVWHFFCIYDGLPPLMYRRGWLPVNRA